jgi:DNA-binding response OmpR family regulator
MHILLIEDSHDLAANVVDYLQALGAVVDYAANGLNGLHLAATRHYDAIVLDLNLPGLDGLGLLTRLRQDSGATTPVLILTARDTERDRLRGFDEGADDYVTKPFSLAELHARLKAIVRRSQGQRGVVLRVADLEFDLRTLVARRAKRRLQLTPSGVRLLEKLMRAAPALVPRAEIEHLLWGDHPPDSEAALRGHIHALRGEIDRGEAQPLLHTVHGIGYRLAPDDAT